MEQKTINQNKLQTLLCIIALTLGVLVSAVLFGVTPVHAAEVSEAEISGLKMYSLVGSCDYVLGDGADPKDYPDFPMFNVNPDPTVFYVSDNVYLAYVQSNDWKSKNVSNAPLTYAFVSTDNFTIIKKSNGKFFKQSPSKFQVNGNDLYFFRVSFSNAIGQNGQVYTDDLYVANLRVNHSVYFYNNDADMFSYLYSVAKDKTDTTIIDPESLDKSYSFTGFTINNKSARWTGTTERSYAKEAEVEEYVKVSYAWATTTEPDKLGELQPYEGEYATSDKQLTLPWSEMEKGKTDFQFIRQVKIFPCYRVPHLAYYIGQPVTIYYNADGTIDKIEQTTIPTDSETIGNDISLIGFRYDNSFHAEWVDVWSNGANKSAFDLSGSQYLSLGVKAVYYDGSKADIDFYSLDRKNLTWNKTFSDFKENNGSPIKSLYFTPYAKTGVNNPWNKGNSTVVNFDENGNASSSFDTGDDGTVHLDDFKLTGVVWNKPVVKNGTITWTGTTPNSDLLFVPDSDTLVTATYPRYDADLNTSYETWSTTTIGKGSMKVNVDYLIDYYKNSELAWNGEMWLTPCYKKGGVLYVGDPVIINCLKGTVSDIVVDKDSGKAEQVDKTDQNKSDADSILNVGNQFYSIINGLIGSLQQLPALLTAIFGFLPSSIINLLYASFAVIIICRILGR